jgi:hypothetical protein
MSKVIYTFESTLKYDPGERDSQLMMTALNFHFFNDGHCNHYIDGKYVAKYPEIEASNPLIKEAYYSVRCGQYVKVFIDLHEDGSKSIRMKAQNEQIAPNQELQIKVCENCGEKVNIRKDGGHHAKCDFVYGRRGWRQLGTYDG